MGIGVAVLKNYRVVSAIVCVGRQFLVRVRSWAKKCRRRTSAMKRNQIIDLSKLVFVAVSCVLVAANATPVDDLQPGHWYEAPNSQLLDVTPSPVPPGVTGVASIMDAWSGGAYDTQRDRLIVWGGGHTDYSGNELYVFDIETLTWTRLTDPTYDVGGGAPYYNDGSPRSRHSYDYLQYLPTIDRFCSHCSVSKLKQSTFGKLLAST